MNYASFVLNFSSRACVPGEIFISGDQSCEKCPARTYSLIFPMLTVEDLQKCFPCPSNAICPGGSLIVPVEGFWRSSPTSTTMLECLSKSSCLGFDDGSLNEEERVHGKCLKNSKGPFCYVCDRGYARFTLKDVCRPCSTEVMVYIKFAITLIGLVLYVFIQISLTFKIGLSSYLGILLKIMVNHIQQISLISIIHFGWTPDFKIFFAIQDYLSFFLDDFLPSECFIFGFEHDLLSQKIIISNIMPIALSILIFFIWAFISLFLKFFKTGKCLKIKNSFETFNVISLVIAVLLFPNIVRKCLELFNCIDLYDEELTRVLLYSPQIVCWEDSHLKYILYCALPGIVAWGIIVPCFIAYYLRRYGKEIREIIKTSKRSNVSTQVEARSPSVLETSDKKTSGSKLKVLRRKGIIISDKMAIKNIGKNERPKLGTINIPESRAASKFSVDYSTGLVALEKLSRNFKNAFLLKFLYKGYSAKYYYWEQYLFIKKFVLISISCITDIFPSFLRSTILIVLFSIFLSIQIRVQPYETIFLNNTVLFSLLTTVLIAVFGAMMFTPDLRNYSIALFVLMIMLNTAFVIYWLLLVIKESSKEFVAVKKFVAFLARRKKQASSRKVIPLPFLKQKVQAN